MLLLPFTLFALFQGWYVFALGGTYINVLLVVNTWLVALGRDHEPVALFGLVPGGTLFMGLSFAFEGGIASAWCFPSVLACYCMLSGRRARLSNAIILAVALPMAWRTFEPVEAVPFMASLLAVSLFASILVREIDAQQRRLRHQLDHDPLTGLLNRAPLATRLDEAIGMSDPASAPPVLLAIDLDHFKRINDRFGHEAGDRVLCAVARSIEREVGAAGAVFRIGGEEFLVLLGAHGERVACGTAERVRRAIAGDEMIVGHPVTVSIGVAALEVPDDRESWMRRADGRLYEAKRGGRDRVVSAVPTVPGVRAQPCRPVKSLPLPEHD